MCVDVCAPTLNGFEGGDDKAVTLVVEGPFRLPAESVWTQGKLGQVAGWWWNGGRDYGWGWVVVVVRDWRGWGRGDFRAKDYVMGSIGRCERPHTAQHQSSHERPRTHTHTRAHPPTTHKHSTTHTHTKHHTHIGFTYRRTRTHTQPHTRTHTYHTHTRNLIPLSVCGYMCACTHILCVPG